MVSYPLSNDSSIFVFQGQPEGRDVCLIEFKMIFLEVAHWRSISCVTRFFTLIFYIMQMHYNYIQLHYRYLRIWSSRLCGSKKCIFEVPFMSSKPIGCKVYIFHTWILWEIKNSPKGWNCRQSFSAFNRIGDWCKNTLLGGRCSKSWVSNVRWFSPNFQGKAPIFFRGEIDVSFREATPWGWSSWFIWLESSQHAVDGDEFNW